MCVPVPKPRKVFDINITSKCTRTTTELPRPNYLTCQPLPAVHLSHLANTVSYTVLHAQRSGNPLMFVQVKVSLADNKVRVKWQRAHKRVVSIACKD